MAFTAITTTQTQVGKPTKRELFETIRTNFNDHEARLLTQEAAANKVLFWSGVITNATSFSTATGLIFHRVQSPITLTDCKIGVFDKGSLTSNLEIDVQKASGLDFTSSVSVFTTRPSIDVGVASNYSESSNTVFSATNKILVEGDYIRIDVTSFPSGGVLSKFAVYLIGEPT